MNKKLIYIITIILSITLGITILYGIYRFFPSEKTQVVNKEKVTVTDEGINKGVNVAYDSVVYIESKVSGKTISTGTGFIYKKDKENGYILTNNHVVEKGDSVTVHFGDNTFVTGTKIGGDLYADIAVIKIPVDKAKSVMEIGNSKKMNLGDTVFTIGAPMGLDYKGTVTRGILSGKDRMVSVSLGSSQNDWIMNVMQTDAAINPGNSGGPLCNVSGQVIGINSLKIVKDSIEGLGFAIPIEDALKYADKIEKNKEFKKPYLGISMIDASNYYQLMLSGIKIDETLDHGVVVDSVEENSAAANAKLLKGDVVIELNKQTINNVAEFRYFLYKYTPGETVTLKVNRNKKIMIIKVKLGEKSN